MSEQVKIYGGPDAWRLNYEGVMYDVEVILQLIEDDRIEEAQEYTRATYNVMREVLSEPSNGI